MTSDSFDFAVPSPRARSTDPATSHKAADAIEPHQKSILHQVEAFAFGRGEQGFIDEDLSKAFEAENVSSYRTRRAELTDRRTILDSGRTKNNEGGRECVIWVHRQFVPQPPMERDARVRPSKDAVALAWRMIDDWALQMKREGRLFAGNLIEAIETARAGH